LIDAYASISDLEGTATPTVTTARGRADVGLDVVFNTNVQIPEALQSTYKGTAADTELFVDIDMSKMNAGLAWTKTNVVTVNGAFAAGDTVISLSTGLTKEAIYKGDLFTIGNEVYLAIVDSATGSAITLDRPLAADLAPGEAAVKGTTEKLTYMLNPKDFKCLVAAPIAPDQVNANQGVLFSPTTGYPLSIEFWRNEGKKENYVRGRNLSDLVLAEGAIIAKVNTGASLSD
jgi:hypothetical protein